MYLVIIGLTFGLVVGTFLKFDIPPEYARYTAVAIVGILDSLFGAVRAQIEKRFDTTVFLSGLLFNMTVAVLLTFLGDELNLDIYLAVLIAFTIRIFSNIGVIKTATVDKLVSKNNQISNEIEN
jgi:small basic protein